MKKKKLIFILIIAVLIIIGSGVYLGTYYHAVDVENDLTTSDTIQIKDFNQGIFFDGPGTTDALIFYPGAKVNTVAYAHSEFFFKYENGKHKPGVLLG